MNAHEQAVLARLVAALADRFSDAGHAMQLVTNEHRGRCRPHECVPSCLGLQALLLDATDWLERETTATPRQAGFWEAAG